MSDLQVRMHGNTVVVTGAYHEKSAGKGKAYEYRDRFTDVWMNISGWWQVIASHYSPRANQGWKTHRKGVYPNRVKSPGLSFSSFQTAQTCATMAPVPTIPPSRVMSLNRHTLTLDEQFFQSVLSAAFTIQEHNDRGKLARQTPARQTQTSNSFRACCPLRSPFRNITTGGNSLVMFLNGERSGQH